MTRVSQRVLRWFVRRGWLDPDEARAMRDWHNDGGFSLDAGVRIPEWDRAGLERLLRYCARPPFALDRLEAVDDAHLRYHLSKPQPDGTTELSLSPLELIDRIAALVPPPRMHRHRYHGVLAPNSPLRDQVTALVREVAADATRDAQASDADQSDADEQVLRSPARYLWATLVARLFERFPLTCPHCCAELPSPSSIGGAVQSCAFPSPMTPTGLLDSRVRTSRPQVPPQRASRVLARNCIPMVSLPTYPL